MESKELRIGNWVYSSFINKENKEWIVEAISEDWIQTIGGVLDCNMVHPIPLTEEWLEKFGFNEWRNRFVGIDETFEVLQILKEGTALMYDKFNDFVVISNNIKYVHQLQNLYFALTNTELEINE